MKKILLSIICILLVMPLMVNAAVTDQTQAELVGPLNDGDPVDAAKTACLAKESANSSLKDATEGYYLYCVSVTCTDSKNVQTAIHPLKDVITCSNGNKDPYVEVKSDGLTSFKKGDACTETSTDPYKYGTQLMHYNCAQTADAGEYKASNSTTGTDNTNNTSGTSTKDDVKPVKTGVEDYYTILGATVLVLCVGLYVINKKNIFKKI